MPHRYTSLLFIVLLFSIGISFGTYASADICSGIPGTRLSTISDAAVQNGTIKAGVCYNPNGVGIAQTSEQAKVFLNSVPKRCVGGCAAPPDKAHIDKLNDTMAVCAANFIKAYNQKYGVIYISSAYRDGPSGENKRAGGSPTSDHTKGLAIDMSPANGDFQTMWSFASQNPQFGVCFPYKGTDRPHMGLAGTGTGEATKCAAQGVAKACSGAPTFTPSAVTAGPTLPYDEGGQLYGNTGPGPAATVPYSPLPASAYGNLLQSPTAPAPIFPSAPPVTTAPTTPTTGICTPQFSCSNNVMYYQTTSCTTQVYQNCVNGCAGNSCAVIAPSTGTSTLIATTTTQASSTAELLNAFANPVSITTAPIGTASPIAVALNSNTSDITGITTAGNSSTTIVNPGTIASIQPLSAQQTFTSSDLSGSNSYSGGTLQASGAFKILSDLKAALTWALNFLTGRKSQ